MKKIALGMSGGVDSSLSAVLLKEQGYDVTGVFLECWRAPGCRSEEDRKDALAVALQLGIPFQVLDFKEAYRKRVVDHFLAEYRAGRTPNPDIWCNEEIKFGLFYDWAMKEGFDAIATGHYAQIKEASLLESGEGNSDLALSLVSSADEHKDQTYFLYRLRPEQLDHVLFPIGHLQKPQVRELAASYHLPTAQKKDSVGICFIGDIDVGKFLLEHLGENPGKVEDFQGHVIGEHRGLWFYTIGQRHGFTISAKSTFTDVDGNQVDRHNIPPFYVISKRPEDNVLVVGFGNETQTAHFLAQNLHWCQPDFSIQELLELSAQGKIFARIRHTGQLLACEIKASSIEATLEIALTNPTAGIAEGQGVVLYTPTNKASTEFVCLGGGEIRISPAVNYK